MGAGRIALGSDPGLANCGFGVIRRDGSRLECLDAGTVSTDSARPLEERQRLIWSTFAELVRTHKPLVFGIEDQSGVNAAARQSVARQIAAARAGREVKGFGFNASNDGVIEIVGVLKSVAFAYGIPVLMLQPRTVKVGLMGPGGGSAEKQEIKAAILRTFPGIGRISSHAADGLAVALGAERESHIESRRAG